MPDLQTSLREYDLGFFHIIAEKWGIELSAPDTGSAISQLLAILLDSEILLEIIETLPEPAVKAVNTLGNSGGKKIWADFSRQFGDIRDMGPGRRDRERPDHNPMSTSEILWYAGIIYRNTFMTDDGAQLMVYIPDDMLKLLPSTHISNETLLGRPATPSERAFQIIVNDWVIDDACTMLSWIRKNSGKSFNTQDIFLEKFNWSIKVHQASALFALLHTAGFVDKKFSIDTDQIRDFLETSRSESLTKLAQSWLESNSFNELSLLPKITLEGDWKNSPQKTRQHILALLARIPVGKWWSLVSFTTEIKNHFPDFQRPGGNFETWYIRDNLTNEYLMGFENWDAVDGALLRYIITGPLHWLGFVDLASTSETGPITAFRLSKWWSDLINNKAPAGLPIEDDAFLISSDARLRAPRLTPRPARYQIARFCEWEDAASDGYRYRITPASLSLAKEQGLVVGQLTALLTRFALTVPPSLIRALEQWDRRGVEAHIQSAVILKVSTPDMIQKLRQSRAARFLGDPLGPTAILLKSNASDKVLSILAELGYLGEVEFPMVDKNHPSMDI